MWGQLKILNWMERLKKKIKFTKKNSIIEKLSSYNPKRNQNQKNEDYIWKNNKSQLWTIWWHWKQIEIWERGPEQKLKIKKIKIKVEISVNERTNLKF